MKLQTTIRPRREGVVNAAGEHGQNFQFKPDEHGVLTCDVTCDETAAHLLSLGGDFYPEYEGDQRRLAESMRAAAAEEDDERDNDEDDAGGGLPVEAGTPPVARKVKAKAK